MSNNFRKSMWRAMFRYSPCCSELARTRAGLPPRNGCCKCVRYGDGCCGGGATSSSGGMGCSKMCCDKQTSTSGPVAAAASVVSGNITGVPEPIATVVRASHPVDIDDVVILNGKNAVPEDNQQPNNRIMHLNYNDKVNLDSYRTSRFYVCCCTQSLSNLGALEAREPRRLISRSLATRYSTSAYHEAPTAELHIDLGNISNI